MSPPVDFGGLYYQPRPAPVDNTPTVQAGAARGNAYSNIGEAVGKGLIIRAKMQEEKRQFDIQTTIRAALAHAQEVRDDALTRHQASQERMQALRDFDLQQHRGVLEQQGQARIDANASKQAAMEASAAAFHDAITKINGGPVDSNTIMGMLPAARTPAEFATIARSAMGAKQSEDAQREKQLAGARREAEVGAAKKLADEMLQRGDLTDQEHALAQMQLDSGDPTQVRQVAQGMVAKSKALDQRAVDDDLRKTGPKELIATLTDKRKGMEEAGLTMDPEQYLEARAAAVAFERSHSSGPALAAEYKALQAKMAGAGSPKKSGGESAGKIVTPGGSVPDNVGLSQGGSFEDMTRGQREALFALGRDEAMKDPLWKLTLQEDIDPAQAKQAQDEMSIKYGNSIAALNGWHAGGQSAQAPQQAATDPAETLRAEETAGKFKTDAEFEARAKELGVELRPK